MPLDPRYVTTVSLEEYLVDKDTGQPLAFGTVEFWEDDNRVVPKLVYELTGAPPNYTYTPFPNPITLSSVGTISDNNGANTPIYYFPYDADGNIQLYYVVVRNSLGVIQFVREGWPNTTEGANPTNQGPNIANQLSNPQFVDVSFVSSAPLVVPLTGATTTTIPIAPRWDLVVTHTATTTITVTRTPIAGISAYPGNPPYTLTVTPGLNISVVQLRQRLENNPDIFGRAVGGENGYIGASVLLAPLSTLNMTYQPNGQAAQIILNANNTSGQYEEFTNTVQLTAANNPTTADTGYVDIILNLPIVGATTFSNVQIVGLDSNVQGVTYDQVTSNREKDQLFNYYNPLLQQKPVSSYLVGWDFPLNPTQTGATVAASAIGANASKYVWDQTIIFQSANSGVGVTRHASGGITLTAAVTTQMGMIQYLQQNVTREILNDAIAANIAAFASVGIVATVSLFYTADASLPNLAANQSLVATLDANGHPLTFNGNWVEIPRSNLGNAQFTIGLSATTNFNDYGFSGWNANGVAGVNTATFFAIVIGTASVPVGNTITFGSVSACRGRIPTRPAAQTPDEVFRQCEYYYEQNYLPGTPAGTVNGGNTVPGELSVPQAILGTSGYPASFTFEYKTIKRVAPVFTPYSYITANTSGVFTFGVNLNGVLSARTGGALLTNPADIAQVGNFALSNTIYGLNVFAQVTSTAQITIAGAGAEAFLIFMYTADARLGLV